MKWVKVFLVAAILVRCGGADSAEPSRTSAAAPAKETVIKALEVEIEKEPFGVGRSIYGLKFSTDGRYFLYLWSPGIIDFTTGKSLAPAVGGGEFIAAISPDVRFLAARDGGRRGPKGLEWHGVSLAEIPSMKIVHTTEIVDHTIRKMQFNAAGTRLFVVSHDRLYVLEVPSGKLLQTVKPFVSPRNLAIAPDGTSYAVRSTWFPKTLGGDAKPSLFGTQVIVYRMDTKEQIKVFEPVRVRSETIDYTPDGRYLVTDASPEPLIYDVTAGKRVSAASSKFRPWPMLALDGRFLLIYDTHVNTNGFLNLQTGAIVPAIMPAQTAELSPGTIVGVAPDGERVVVTRHNYQTRRGLMYRGRLRTIHEGDAAGSRTQDRQQ